MVDRACDGEFRSSLYVAADPVQRSDPEPLHRRQSSHGEAILSSADCPRSQVARFRDLRRDGFFAVVPAMCPRPFELFKKRPRF